MQKTIKEVQVTSYKCMSANKESRDKYFLMHLIIGKW